MAASSARLPGGGLAPAATGPGGAGWEEQKGEGGSSFYREDEGVGGRHHPDIKA